jgi:hypothetical protein
MAPKIFFLQVICVLFVGISALPYLDDEGHVRNIPLKSLYVSGEFFDSLGEVVIKQNWFNDGNSSIKSSYKFPLDSGVVVSGFKMKIGDKTFTGKAH